MRTGQNWIGLDVGGSKILALYVDQDLEVLDCTKIDTGAEDGPEAVLTRIVDLVRAMCRRHETDAPIGGVGIGVAGLVDHQRGSVQSSVILPGWDDIPVAEILGGALDRALYVDNDASSAGYGEYQALGKPPGLNMILLTLGTGIGGTILIDGRLYRGSTNMSGEFGNTTIDWKGPDCPSGNRGSLNSMASGRAIAAQAQDIAKRHPNSTLAGLDRPLDCAALAPLYPENDQVRDIVDRAAQVIGVGIANIIQIFNPDRVSLMGGLCGFGDRFLDLISCQAKARSFSVPAGHVAVGLTIHRDRAGAIGAAALARDRTGSR